MQNHSDQFIDLLRHGETTNLTGFCGNSDEPLSDRGWAQMLASSQHSVLQMPQIGDVAPTIISSPARRCADFARYLAAQHGATLRINSDLRERHFGVWEGLTAAQLPAAAHGAWWNDPVNFTPPAAESVMAFRARVARAWREFLQTADCSHHLLITHGGVIRVILAEVLQQPNTALWQIDVPHANLTRLRRSPAPAQPCLVFHRNF